MNINTVLTEEETLRMEDKLGPENPLELEEWQKNLLSHLWNSETRSPQNYTDLKFKCSDGSISAHKSLLCLACPILWRILKGPDIKDECKLTVIVPDFKLKTVQQFLQLLYTGVMVYNEDVELEEVSAFGMKQLGFTIDLKFKAFSEKKVTADNDDIECLGEKVTLAPSRFKRKRSLQSSISSSLSKRSSLSISTSLSTRISTSLSTSLSTSMSSQDQLQVSLSETKSHICHMCGCRTASLVELEKHKISFHDNSNNFNNMTNIKDSFNNIRDNFNIRTNISDSNNSHSMNNLNKISYMNNMTNINNLTNSNNMNIEMEDLSSSIVEIEDPNILHESQTKQIGNHLTSSNQMNKPLVDFKKNIVNLSLPDLKFEFQNNSSNQPNVVLQEPATAINLVTQVKQEKITFGDKIWNQNIPKIVVGPNMINYTQPRVVASYSQSSTEAKRFSCHKCPESFSEPYGLEKHILRQHSSKNETTTLHSKTQFKVTMLSNIKNETANSSKPKGMVLVTSAQNEMTIDPKTPDRVSMSNNKNEAITIPKTQTIVSITNNKTQNKVLIPSSNKIEAITIPKTLETITLQRSSKNEGTNISKANDIVPGSCNKSQVTSISKANDLVLLQKNKYVATHSTIAKDAVLVANNSNVVINSSKLSKLVSQPSNKNELTNSSKAHGGTVTVTTSNGFKDNNVSLRPERFYPVVSNSRSNNSQNLNNYNSKKVSRKKTKKPQCPICKKYLCNQNYVDKHLKNCHGVQSSEN
jgi:hypothetical protein